MAELLTTRLLLLDAASKMKALTEAPQQSFTLYCAPALPTNPGLAGRRTAITSLAPLIMFCRNLVSVPQGFWSQSPGCLLRASCPFDLRRHQWALDMTTLAGWCALHPPHCVAPGSHTTRGNQVYQHPQQTKTRAL